MAISEIGRSRKPDLFNAFDDLCILTGMVVTCILPIYMFMFPSDISAMSSIYFILFSFFPNFYSFCERYFTV